MPPPPGGAPPDSAAPTSPPNASPAPPTPSPQMQQGTQIAIGVASALRAIAKAYPGTAPLVSQMNDLLRQVTAKMMEGAQTGEPQAGPTG